jgi:hypothetical protein
MIPQEAVREESCRAYLPDGIWKMREPQVDLKGKTLLNLTDSLLNSSAFCLGCNLILACLLDALKLVLSVGF